MKKVLHFLCWQVFISSVGKFSLPQLASFYFLSWQVSTSSVGKFLLPQLACFCFLSWQMVRGNAIGA
ncbi:MAG: hypothetical protein PUJ41_04145 [Bacteroidales bacterium]|nr:hypothetical protein [Bacteroidales bacterium]MDY4142191.1 hypothetical protein [Sodaliphilus sp.]